jgi:small subunit ribosomal protein S8
VLKKARGNLIKFCLSMTTDTLGDSLARIRNAIMRKQKQVELQKSRMVAEVCRILQENKFIKEFDIKDDARVINVTLNYEDGESSKLVSSLQRVSKPGLRIYRGYKELRPVLNGYGIAIISTPKGVMSDRDARKNKVGGELLCEIY